ncbi:hypothetical protein H0H81_005173, partial [Sphagnurus paluster]
MKRFGCAPPIPDDWVCGYDEEKERSLWESMYQDAMWWEVVPIGKGPRGKYAKSEDGLKGCKYRERKEDGEITLGDVWNVDGGNLTDGECANREVGIEHF